MFVRQGKIVQGKTNPVAPLASLMSGNSRRHAAWETNTEEKRRSLSVFSGKVSSAAAFTSLPERLSGIEAA